MALFKPLNGNSSALGDVPLHDGYVYFVKDENKFYLDIADDGGTVIRRALNAQNANSLLGGVPASPVDNTLYWDQTVNRFVYYTMVGSTQSAHYLDYQTPQTTLSGYGITDAKITSGTIILGSNSITPITSASGTSPISASVNATTHALSVSHGASGVTAGTYWTVEVNALGHVTAGNNTTVLPITQGGTGASTAATARSNLGLGNVNNTSDADKPISTATQTALNGKQATLTFDGTYNASTNKAATVATVTNKIATLDVSDTAVSGQYVSAVSETDGKITVTRAALPTYSVATQSANGLMSSTDKTKLDAFGAASTYQAAIAGAATTITASNLTVSRALVSDANGKVAVSAVTATELGYLDGVTSAIQTQLGTKSPLASPTFTGTPKAPTAAAGTNTTQLATTAFVQTAIANAGGVAKYSVNIGDGSSTSITVTHNLGTKDVIVQGYVVSTGANMWLEYTVPTVNTVVLTFSSAPASSSIRIVVLG